MFQHVRQHMPVRGVGAAQQSSARKFIAMQAMAPQGAIFDGDIEEAVVARISSQAGRIAGLPIKAGGVYYLVRSTSPKFPHYFYVVAKFGDCYICSSREARVQRYCVEAVTEYATAKVA